MSSEWEARNRMFDCSRKFRARWRAFSRK